MLKKRVAVTYRFFVKISECIINKGKYHFVKKQESVFRFFKLELEKYKILLPSLNRIKSKFYLHVIRKSAYHFSPYRF